MTTKNNATSTNVDQKICFIGVGGAGAKSASMVADDLSDQVDAVLIDRDDTDLRALRYGTKLTVGQPMFTARIQNGIRSDEPVDESDMVRVRAALNDYRRVYVLMGLGGDATNDLAPSVIETAIATGAPVIAVCSLPFTFEGPMRRRVAEDTLRRVQDAGCPVALVDADDALSETASVGNVAEELTKAHAKVIMSLMTADRSWKASALSDSGDGSGLDIVATSNRVFVSHGAGESTEELRKAVREAVRRPLTTSLALSEAARVVMTISAPPDLPIKTLNGVMTAIERDMAPDAQVSTGFIALPANAKKVKVSIVAGDQPELAAAADDTSDATASDELEPSDVDADDDDDELGKVDAVDAAEQALAAAAATSAAASASKGAVAASSNGHAAHPEGTQLL